MNYFNQIYRLMWLILIVLLMYLFFQDRTIELVNGNKEIISAYQASPYLSIIIIIFILILTSISVLRSLERRNQWRQIAKEDNVDEKISRIKDKKTE